MKDTFFTSGVKREIERVKEFEIEELRDKDAICSYD